jgi:hypothetical protein
LEYGNPNHGRRLGCGQEHTNTDIAAMTWSCDLTDRDGQLVGRGVPVTFAIVPKNTVAVGTVYLYANGGMFNGANCHLVAKEDMTAQNARLYNPGPERFNEPADHSRYWRNESQSHGWTFTATTETNGNVSPPSLKAEPEVKKRTLKYPDDQPGFANQAAHLAMYIQVCKDRVSTDVLERMLALAKRIPADVSRKAVKDAQDDVAEHGANVFCDTETAVMKEIGPALENLIRSAN